jgi:hypothetical protein
MKYCLILLTCVAITFSLKFHRNVQLSIEHTNVIIGYEQVEMTIKLEADAETMYLLFCFNIKSDIFKKLSGLGFEVVDGNCIKNEAVLCEADLRRCFFISQSTENVVLLIFSNNQKETTKQDKQKLQKLYKNIVAKRMSFIDNITHEKLVLFEHATNLLYGFERIFYCFSLEADQVSSVVELMSIIKLQFKAHKNNYADKASQNSIMSRVNFQAVDDANYEAITLDQDINDDQNGFITLNDPGLENKKEIYACLETTRSNLYDLKNRFLMSTKKVKKEIKARWTEYKELIAADKVNRMMPVFAGLVAKVLFYNYDYFDDIYKIVSNNPYGILKGISSVLFPTEKEFKKGYKGNTYCEAELICLKDIEYYEKTVKEYTKDSLYVNFTKLIGYFK